MKKTGAELAVFALEQLGIQYTFGIPGTHTTELYDAINNSEKIKPILVTHEGGAAFMAEGMARIGGLIGALTIVPGAGVSHAMSGIGEAFLDGVPMLVISGGTRRDSGRHYQLHQIDLAKMVAGVTKKSYLIAQHSDVIPMLYDAYETALRGEPGPVFIEMPVEIMMFQGEVADMPPYRPQTGAEPPDRDAVKTIVDMLINAKRPAIYLGWGSMGATAETQQLADSLVAPVATTLQGKSAFPANHALHTGVGFGPTGLPAAQKTFAGCDCILAVGCRFAEIATGSYGVTVPENLIHIDINPEVFNKNYPAKITMAADALIAVRAILDELGQRNWVSPRNKESLAATIATEKKRYFSLWTEKKNDKRVSPGFFFEALRQRLPDDGYMVTDDGNHTFLAAELFPVRHARQFISPTDFNCMGYCVPAAIGMKLAKPECPVVAIVGDGAALMTGLEMLTASRYGLGIVYFIFHDGELGQIAQFQEIPLNRKTCTVLSDIKFEGIAIATGAKYFDLKNDHEIGTVIDAAFEAANEGVPVLVDVRIDYSRKSLLTKGVVKTNLMRFPFKEKVRFIGRAIKRQILG